MKIYDYNGKKNICGERLRQARVIQRLRQEDLAAKVQTQGVNMERDSISRIEIGTRFVSDFELKIFAPMKRNCAPTLKRKSCFRGGSNGRKAENENFFGGKKPL